MSHPCLPALTLWALCPCTHTQDKPQCPGQLGLPPSSSCPGATSFRSHPCSCWIPKWLSPRAAEGLLRPAWLHLLLCESHPSRPKAFWGSLGHFGGQLPAGLRTYLVGADSTDFAKFCRARKLGPKDARGTACNLGGLSCPQGSSCVPQLGMRVMRMAGAARAMMLGLVVLENVGNRSHCHIHWEPGTRWAGSSLGGWGLCWFSPGWS